MNETAKLKNAVLNVLQTDPKTKYIPYADVCAIVDVIFRILKIRENKV